MKVIYIEARIVSRNRGLWSVSCILERSVTFGFETIVGFVHEDAIVIFYQNHSQWKAS